LCVIGIGTVLTTIRFGLPHQVWSAVWVGSALLIAASSDCDDSDLTGAVQPRELIHC